jgi:hypothetical protein
MAAGLMVILLPMSAAYAAQWLDALKDPEDGQLDLSEWLLDSKGFLPVPIIITEPALGFGGGVVATFFRESIREASSRRQDEGRLAPPDIYFIGGGATENGTWFGAGGGMVSFDNDRFRWRGGVMRMSVNLDFYGFGGNLGPIGYNLDGWASVQHGMWRLGQSDWWAVARWNYLDLGSRFECQKILFKKYPSCGLTLGSTDLILSLMREAEGKDISADTVERVKVTVPPYTYKLVGHPFEMGTTPRVNAQFSIRYCVANALFRRSSKLAHFEEEAIRTPQVLDLAQRVDVVVDPAMEVRGHTPVDMTVCMKDGRELFRRIEVAPGFPGTRSARRSRKPASRTVSPMLRSRFPRRR